MQYREPMLVRVSRATRPQHAPADTDRLALMDVTSIAQYRSFLTRIYGLESSVELEVSRVLAREPNAAGLRMRIGRLHDDLIALGMSNYDVAALRTCAAINLRTRAEALGWLFVLERGTLFSGLIRRYLSVQLPDGVAKAAGYLDAYGTGAGYRLRVFGDFMNDQSNRGLVDQASIVAAALSAFQVQRHWYAPEVRKRRYAAPRVAVAT